MTFKKDDPDINRNGRPKGSVSIVSAIKKKLEEEHPDSTPEEKKTWLDMIVTKIFEKGVSGDVSMLKDMIDRTDGKSKETLDVTTKGESLNDLKDKDLNKLIDIYESRGEDKVSEGDSK